MNIRKCNLSGIRAALIGDIDLFICSASYERRSRSIADNLPVAKVKHAIVAETLHQHRHRSEHGNHLRKRFFGKVTDLKIDRQNPVATADHMMAALKSKQAQNCRTMLIDITTFTHEALMILVGLLRQRAKENLEIQFCYTSASEYGVGLEDKDKWLSKGVAEIRSVLGFPGEMAPSRRLHLIILVGFESERAAMMVRAYEPAFITLGHGEAGSETHARHAAANVRFMELARSMAAIYAEVNNFTFTCNDPQKTKQAIDAQIKKKPGFNAVVAPMNTKISTLGAVLAAIENPAIQLSYACPLMYNYAGYSTPGDTCYLFELPELFRQ